MATHSTVAPRSARRCSPATRSGTQRRAALARKGKAAVHSVTPDERAAPATPTLRLVLLAALLACGLWSYWPTLVNLSSIWSRVADYAHGFFVMPLAVYFLWVHRDRFPGLHATSPLIALGLLLASLVLRHAGDAFYFTFLDGWSLVLWTAAAAALAGGRPLLAWCWPSLLFLIFMVPLPFSLENELSGPLQRIATEISTQTLQFLGQPGFAEGNVIVLGQQRLEVAQACSGLRLFLGVVALSYAYVVVVRRPLWEKLVLLASAAPIAVVANAARIVVTGLLFQQLQPNPVARAWIHDGAGWGMILLAAALFWLVLWYLKRLIREEESLDMLTVIRQCRV